MKLKSYCKKKNQKPKNSILIGYLKNKTKQKTDKQTKTIKNCGISRDISTIFLPKGLLF